MKQKFLKKPNWIKIKFSEKNFKQITYIKNIIKNNNLHSVCEEASCPNLIECFGKGQVTFMILGNICTRNCSYCNVKHGRPIIKKYHDEALNLANTILKMKLKYVVITSVNRDDLHDGGAQYFVDYIHQIKIKNPNIKIEILVPDFKNSIEKSLIILGKDLPHVFNHNLETVKRLHKQIRPGGNYHKSLILLNKFKYLYPHILVKSGLMIGLGESFKELYETIKDLKNNNVDILTIGQYLQPTKKHINVYKYYSIKEFQNIQEQAMSIGFKKVICGPFIRSSYNAEYYS
ncbi:lipoyl synthase [Enterobacteriaceae endosymbiont of Neohaemonia nigricornis]|uniref:lipoyl synthase n=1 Tax=Enterobacteriaceae endosymbiont of Neohaemonia nigricornis TaxID=2675792 RepID=UPI001448F250|nr:lipoyl synthase [Enterobacteriaceae endosymbiont of Neohaemonia nigricornis]QJC30271.1 lipoyl synthase [Enterobacteriaceae endosymbiont of Neohaemonia nigricornis]